MLRRTAVAVVATALLVLGGTACDPENPPVKPDATNTGPTTPVEELTHRTPAQVESECASDGLVEHVYIDGGNVDPASNCTIRDFVLDGGQAPYGIRTVNGQTGVKVEDGEVFDVASTGGYGSGTTYQRIDVHDSGGDGFKPRSGTVIASSWCHDIGTAVDAHADCVQFDGPDGSTISDVAVIGNNFDLNVDTLVAPYKANAAVQVNGAITMTNITVAYNWLVGGNFTLNCSNSDINVDDNVFGVGDPSQYTLDPGPDGIVGTDDDRSVEAQAAAARYGAHSGGCSNPDNEGNTWATGVPLAIS